MKRARAEILSTRTIGAYRSITLVAPEIAERSRPGQFLAIAMPEGRAFILRRHFSIHQASRRGGWAGTLEFVVDPSAGAGTGWLAAARAHEFLDVIGPLGKAFSYPKRLTNCLLVAEGRGAASLFFLAQELVARHKRVVARPSLQLGRGEFVQPAGRIPESCVVRPQCQRSVDELQPFCIASPAGDQHGRQMLQRLDVVVGLGVAGLINLSMLMVAASVFHSAGGGSAASPPAARDYGEAPADASASCDPAARAFSKRSAASADRPAAAAARESSRSVTSPAGRRNGAGGQVSRARSSTGTPSKD